MSGRAEEVRKMGRKRRIHRVSGAVGTVACLSCNPHVPSKRRTTCYTLSCPKLKAKIARG
ncbi:hypothetical protein ACFLU4_01965 [Chloroflexota bacterium]